MLRQRLVSADHKNLFPVRLTYRADFIVNLISDGIV